ncbi:MAG: hypothetical protein Q4G03_01475 [Planctomycetia bacterium]|nr:hypothetical protein [Planctomycetia bacterium]
MASPLLASLLACASLMLGLNVARAQSDGSANMRTIKPFIGYEETVQWSDVPEILANAQDAQDESYAWAADLLFTREVWQLEFSYKTVRSIDVLLPTSDGQLQTARVWYLVYSVTNTGQCKRADLEDTLSFTKGSGNNAEEVTFKPSVSTTLVAYPDDEDDRNAILQQSGKRETRNYEHPLNNLPGVFKPVDVDYLDAPQDADGNVPGTVRFIPRFILATATIQHDVVYERRPGSKYLVGQTRGAEDAVYYDTYIPLAYDKIVEREKRGNMEFYTSVRMAARDIKPGETVWGVAMWRDVDPRIDKFSVYISGLTNAFRWDYNAEEATEQFGSGRDIYRKILKLNFINPGDDKNSGKEIYKTLPGELDYQWIYL